MAQVIRKTEATFPGPWLLDKPALTALDDILDEQSSRLKAHEKRQIENEKRKAEALMASGILVAVVDTGDSSLARRITLTLSSGNKIIANSFREAFDDVHFEGHEIAKVEVNIYCGGIRGDMAVPTPKSGELSLVTLPEASDAADELFVKLRGWAEQYKPDLLRRTRSLPFLIVWLFALLLLLLVTMLGAAAGAISETNTWGQEVRELLAGGVRAEDHGRALELLLQKAAGLDQSRGTTHLPVWWGVVAATLAIVAALLSIPAHTAFEIGKGAASVRRQKRYDWLLRKAIPAFLIMGVLASTLGSFAFEFLRAK